MIAKICKSSEDDLLNVDYMANISSYIWTLHTGARQEANESGSVGDKIKKGTNHTLNGVVLSNEIMVNYYKAVMASYGFKYTKQPEYRANIGTLTSLLALLIMFKSKLSEVRLGINNLVHRKTPDVEEMINISSYGFHSEHFPFLSGCKMAPAIKSASRQTLGPLTIAIMLCNATKKEYQDSILNAFMHCFANLPNAAQLANVLKGSTNKSTDYRVVERIL